MTYAQTYFAETAAIAGKLDCSAVEILTDHFVMLREKRGRLFIAGLGGGAANASHAANDFRKLCDIEAYCLSDNVAELTINDTEVITFVCPQTEQAAGFAADAYARIGASSENERKR